jgi:hypothetical protein
MANRISRIHLRRFGWDVWWRRSETFSIAGRSAQRRGYSRAPKAARQMGTAAAAARGGALTNPAWCSPAAGRDRRPTWRRIAWCRP